MKSSVESLLGYALLLVAITLGCALVELVRTTTRTVAALPGEIQAMRISLVAEVHQATQQVVQRLDAQLTALRRQSFAQIADFGAVADRRIGDTLARVDRTLALAEGLHASAQPVLDNLAATEAKFGLLADNYAALPDRVGAEFRPAWLSLQPEITCRQLDGAGYGGCWHSRVTALMGEAAKVGGVFTQRFPDIADNFVRIGGDFHGILGDAHQWTTKYVAPHKMTKGDYLKATGKITLGLGVAGLRGGVF